MDKATLERAIAALASRGATELPGLHPELRKPSASAFQPLRQGEIEACGSSHCAGCYDVGDGRRIHPPKCSDEYRKWLERWEPKGIPQ